MSSPIEERHPDFKKYHDQWTRCRDAIEGTDAIHKAGKTYLPLLPSQSTEEYSAYKSRALWYNATGRTLDGLTGLVFSVPPIIEIPSGAEPLLEDANLMGKPFVDVAEDCLEEVIGLGRYGIYVDHPPLVEGVSKADAERLGMRPYLICCEVETITNWAYVRKNNRTILGQIVLLNGADSQGNMIYKELVLLEDGYHIRIWEREKVGENKVNPEYRIVSDVVPTKNGQALDLIPFWFLGPEYGDNDVDSSPLLDLVDVNISHYRTSADLEHALFHCGLPTPIFAGFNFEKGEVVKLGGTGGISSNDPNAKAYYLEFSGDGTQALERAMDRKEAMMAKLGARMLAEDKKAAEAAETLKIRASGESSSLASVANSVSSSLTKILAFMCDWMGLDGSKALVKLNTDYSAAGMSSQDVVAMIQAFQAGTIPLREVVERFKEGGIISPTSNTDDVLAELPTPLGGMTQ